MSRISEYRDELRRQAEWEPYLLTHSGLPGPRGNLELAHAVAQEGTEEQFRQWAALTPEQAPENTPQAFLAFCGVLGLGAVLGRYSSHRTGPDGASQVTPEASILATLRGLASDPRWRIREAVATGLQLWGDANMPALLAEMQAWAGGGFYEQRAAAATLCEPRLLAAPANAAAVLELLDRITHGIAESTPAERKSEPFGTLRQALGYCWSVAVAAEPGAGVPAMERWLADLDPDVRWIMRENLKKKRIAGLKIDARE